VADDLRVCVCEREREFARDLFVERKALDAHLVLSPLDPLLDLPLRYSSQFKNNYFTEICSGSEAGSYLRLIDFVYHSTLGLRVIQKEKKEGGRPWRGGRRCRGRGASPALTCMIQLPWREAGPPNHHDDKVDSDSDRGAAKEGVEDVQHLQPPHAVLCLPFPVHLCVCEREREKEKERGRRVSSEGCRL